ncbi:MAG: hypothetical protein SOY60_03575 [Fusobacterium gastrosuis]|uniref:hypothetical protein n=1 Tax=Fusobacterium gastrosuis TaxID=1755100 RepID=UPI002A8D672C|nr:hypothetical protein [Fusobacterium gastrosuis]
MNDIKIFENKEVRSIWVEEKEEWYFSVVDIVGVLTEQKTTRGASNYWKVLKNRLNAEGSGVITFCNQLKLKAQES